MIKPVPIILGIDEAGRGPVIGPLVLCGLWVQCSRLPGLVRLNLRDSKAYGSSPSARRIRAKLALRIREHCHQITFLIIGAQEVDRRVEKGELNQLEQELAQTLIYSGPCCQKIHADGEKIFGPLQKKFPQLHAQDKADSLVPVVAAASILAKVERDDQFNKLTQRFDNEEWGPVKGQGYPNPATAQFLGAYMKRYGTLPSDVRRSWCWPPLQSLMKQF